ncbi:MAG: 5-formyltetrahydrofolate cyclo-ligase [Bacteroidota bacterium]
MTKVALREKYKALRGQLSPEAIEDQSIQIANQLLTLPVWDKGYYHLFLPMKRQKEIDTRFILTLLQGKDKEIVVSKSHFTSNTLTHYLLTDSTILKENSYGIPEPVDGISVPVSKIDVVFVPLLAFDKKGNRVGYGKGFYDTFLAECKATTLKIGLSFFDAETRIDAVSGTDIPLHYCVTPEKVYDFSS